MSNNSNYTKYNYFAIFGHFTSAILMSILYYDKPSLVIPYTETYLEWKPVPNNSTCERGSREFDTSDGKFCIGSTTQPVSCNDDGCYGIDLGWLIISFHLLSFVFQSFAAVTYFTPPILGYKYNIMVENNKNPLRFIEYSFSASIMLIAIALLNGVTDINLITSIAVLTASCQLCGLAVEYIQEKAIKWVVHLTGWLQFMWAYGIIGHAFFKSIDSAKESSNTGPPSFVYAIVIALFLLYSSFGFVQLMELITGLNPFTKEKSYVILSLTAKLLLGWMIFSNVLVLS